jgi:hypothetical protein
MLLQTLLLALAATRATALVIDLSAAAIERQDLGAAANRTYVCQEWTWGGCCTGLDDAGWGTDCIFYSSFPPTDNIKKPLYKY